jgi:signal transduction histidine kinase
MQALADQIAREVHRLALDLRPAALDDLGLPTALANYVETWSQRAKIEADLQCSGLDRRLSLPVETALYRIVQEALTNVARHAHAGRASVILERVNGIVRAIVEDNGRGFDVQEVMHSPEAGRCLGLLGMNERLVELGGTLEIESSPGHGTTLFASVPLEEDEEAAHG